ncbi:MAG: hypothetical protein MSS98_04045 [Alphaproteobacteria bacterium]|nr:hypothetical protein [Alphaproteobacteria bacterium]MDY4689023.1 hypothetical protein [Alphaproteobacteria bacterium]
MAEPSTKPQKYIPNAFEAAALQELHKPWRFYDSKEEFEKVVAEFSTETFQTEGGEITKWEAARANGLISFGAKLQNYEKDTLDAAEKQIRSDKPLWSKIQAVHLYNTAGFKPQIDLADGDEISAEDILQKISENLKKMEKGKIVDGKYQPSKPERNVLRALGNYGEFIRNPKDEKETARFYEEIQKRFNKISKREDYQKFESKQQKKQSQKTERKDNTMSDDKEFKLSDEQLEFCKAHGIEAASITSEEAYKEAVKKFSNENTDSQKGETKTDDKDNKKDDSQKIAENGGKDEDKDESKDDKDDKDKPALKIHEAQPQPEDKTNEETPDWVTKKAKWYKAQAEAGEIENYEQDTSKEGFAAKFNNAEIHYSSPDDVTVSPDADYKVFDTMLKEPDNKGRPIEFPDNASKEIATRLYAACVLNGNPMQGAVPTELDAETLAKSGLSEEQIKQVQDHLAASQQKNDGKEQTGDEKKGEEKTEQKESHEAPELQVSDKAKADIQKISEIKKNFEQMKKDGLIAIQKDENGKPQIVAGEKGSAEDVKNATAIMKEAAAIVKAGLSENRGKDIAHDTVKLETQQQKDTNTALRTEQIAILKMQRGGR